jgi:hypothetical protein
MGKDPPPLVTRKASRRKYIGRHLWHKKDAAISWAHKKVAAVYIGNITIGAM